MKKSLIVMLILVAALMIVGCTPEEHVHELNKVEGIPATCTSTGVADYWVCGGCNKLFADANGANEIVIDYTLTQQLTTPMVAHSYVDDKDCTTANKCKNCDATEPAPHTEHTPRADDGDCTTAIKCQNCDVVVVDKKAHTGGTANCTTKANCTECGKAYGSFDSNAHDFSGAHYCWSADYTTCTVAGECVRCEKVIYEVVATTYANGKAVAAFTTPTIGTRYFALNDYSGKDAEEIDAAITYMLANGETDIEVIFPSMSDNEGAVYEAFYAVVTWALEGYKVPGEITQAYNAYLWVMSKIPGAIDTAKITALDRYNWAKENVISFIESVNP